MKSPLVLPCLALLGILSIDPAPGRVSIELATLHVAALTATRGAADNSDAPYFLVSVLRNGARTSAHFPAEGHWRLEENAIVRPTAMDVLELGPGDSARVVISVLESESTDLKPELDGATATTTALAGLSQPLLDPAGPALGTALGALTQAGAHRIGSVSLLLTNEGGSIWWRRMECIQDCAMLKGLAPQGGTSLTTATNGVFELTGAGGTYHLNLNLTALE